MIRELWRRFYRRYLEPDWKKRRREQRECDHIWEVEREYTKVLGPSPGDSEDVLMFPARKCERVRCQECNIARSRSQSSLTYRVDAEIIAKNDFDEPVYYHNA